MKIKLVLSEDENDDNFLNGDYTKTAAEHVIVYITADDDNSN